MYWAPVDDRYPAAGVREKTKLLYGKMITYRYSWLFQNARKRMNPFLRTTDESSVLNKPMAKAPKSTEIWSLDRVNGTPPPPKKKSGEKITTIFETREDYNLFGTTCGDCRWFDDKLIVFAQDLHWRNLERGNRFFSSPVCLNLYNVGLTSVIILNEINNYATTATLYRYIIAPLSIMRYMNINT